MDDRKSCGDKTQGGAPITGPVPGSNNIASSHTTRLYCYPGPIVSDPELYNAQPSLGYLYNWSAATNQRAGASGAGQDIEEGGTNPSAIVQGICPDGWHLPTDREWTDLENEIIAHTSQYASMADIGTGDLAYDRGRGSFGTHGQAMKGRCMIKSSALGDSFGRSFPATEGGFDAYLAGYAPGPLLYGETSYFWTSSFHYDSSAGGNFSAWLRKLDAAWDTVARQVQGRQHLFSIRCKKDN